MGPVGARLERAGYRVGTPLLAGHGGDLAALEATSWPDWFRSAEDAFDALAANADGRVAVVGFSMGGLLALRLAQTRGDRIAALAILAAPLHLRAWHARTIRWLGTIPSRWRMGPLRAVPKFFGSDVSIPELRRSMPGLNAMPLSGLQSLMDLMATVRAEVANIPTRIPVLVAHGRNDRAVPIADSYELADRLQAGAPISGDAGSSFDPVAGSSAPAGPGTRVVERLWLERSGHLIAVDVERERLADAIATFFETRVHW